jgi:hypothetical protein
MNQCCTTADCKQGKCYSTDVYPYCGGPPQQVYNECAYDECMGDPECMPGPNFGPRICAPAGYLGVPVRSCVGAYCHTDADCTAHPCGTCAPITGPCCGFPHVLGCVYPGGCIKSSDCKQGQACTVDPMTSTATCSGGVACPV